MYFSWGTVRSADGLVQVAGMNGSHGPEYKGHSLVGGFGNSIREAILLSVSMILVLFNLLDGPGDRKQ
jgi:hypothetical protein